MNAPPLIVDALWQALGSILDPEFGISIVDMGLIYSVRHEGGAAHVVMTLTTPACPSGEWIRAGARAALSRVPGVASVRVDLVFDPAWNPAMLSPRAQQQLGWRAEN